MRADELRKTLEGLDRRPYPAYRDLRGRRFAVGPLSLRLLYVQGDPFAAPSRLEVVAPPAVAGLPGAARVDAVARRATADLLHRAVGRALQRVDGGRGSGKSGRVALARRLPVRSSNEKPRGETPGAFFFGRGGPPLLQSLSVASSLRSWRMHSGAIFLLSRKVCIGGCSMCPTTTRASFV